MLRSTLLFAAAALSGSPGLSQTQLRTVDRFGGGDFEAIQDAVNASSDGDVILVERGNFLERVTIAGKGIALVAAAPNPAPVILNGELTVRGYQGDQGVLLDNLLVRRGIDVENCGGGVFVQGCRLTHSSLAQLPSVVQSSYGDCDVGVALMEVTDADHLVVSTSLIQGRRGFQYLAWGTPGEHAVRIGSSFLDLYDAVLQGGDGGPGLASFSGTLGGAGGHGLFLRPGCEANAIGVTMTGGAGGPGLHPQAPDGCPGDPFLVNNMATLEVFDTPRLRWTGPLLLPEGQTIGLEVVAPAGSTRTLLSSSGLRRQILSGENILHLRAPLTIEQAGTMPAGSATAALPFTAPTLPPGDEAGVVYVQLRASSSRFTLYSSPIAIVVIDDAL